MTTRLDFPEIEVAAVGYNDLVEQSYSKYQLEPPTTLVDLLEIRPPEETVWKPGLDHYSLLAHFECAASNNTMAPPVLRMFFLEALELGSDKAEMYQNLKIFQSARLHPSTASWMRDRFAVSPIFLNCCVTGDSVANGHCSKCSKRDNGGSVVAIAGFYLMSPTDDGFYTHVWFSHDLKTGSSTYILQNCSAVAKNMILNCASGENREALGRPCAIDIFIADETSKLLARQIASDRDVLHQYENRSNPFSPGTAFIFEDLHYLARKFHTHSGLITDLEQRLEFLRTVHRKCAAHAPETLTRGSVAESLHFVASRTSQWKGWAVNYKERADIQINLYFNLAAQNDSHTNLDISKFTSNIAVDTQRDSSAMITIAAVTMLFLPGTFISAIFSMVFFNSEKDANGTTVLTTSPQWWYFIAITVPLTIVVFLVCVMGLHLRNKAKGTSITNNPEEKA